jgi:ligand-binding sensor protein
MRNHISMCQLINYQLFTDHFIGLVIHKSSNSGTRLCCNTTINGVSGKSYITRYWEKGEGISQFLDQFRNVNQVGNFVVHCGGVIELVGKPKIVQFCPAPQFMAKVIVSKNYSEVCRKMENTCLCRVISSVWTWEREIVQSFYLRNIIRKHSKNIVVK